MLLRGTEEAETRKLILVGAAAFAVVSLVVLGIALNPFAGSGPRPVSVTIDTPYVGQGVAKGTAMVIHGVKVGEVTSVSSLAAGGVRLNADLEPGPVNGLTDTFNVDFRPVNYFGVTGVNLTANPGGQALRDGMRIAKMPKGNFTLQALLSRLGELSKGVITPQLVHVVDVGTRYVDALDPLIETMVTAANAVADTQTVRTAQLLCNTTEFSVRMPPFVDQLTEAGDAYVHADRANPYHVGFQHFTEKFWRERGLEVGRAAAEDVFGTVGKLEYSHVGDLLPLIGAIKSLTDVVPPLIRPEGIAQTLVALRTRFENLYAGTPGQRAMRVRLVLDSLPGVAAPLGVVEGSR